jgi:signal peptidase II
VSRLFTRNRLYGLAVAVVVCGIDRLLKWLVIGPLQLQGLHTAHALSGWPVDRPDIPLLPVFGLTWTENVGVSLGMLPAASMEMRYLLIAVTALIALGVFAWMLRETRMWDIAALGLILGGAAGNIADRWHYGYVVDYADLHFGAWRPFLIFNLADAAITFGVVIVLARSLFLREKRGASAPETQSSEQAAETN